MKKLFTLLALLLIGEMIVAQPSAGGTPYGLGKTAIPKASLFKLSPVDVQSYLQEDALLAAQGDKSLRFGIDVPVALSMNTHGTWTDLPNGLRMWRLAIESEGAKNINLIFNRFKLSEGGKLFVYSADGSDVKGAFTRANENVHGSFSILPVQGDRIVVEYSEPNRVPSSAQLEIGYVIHGYRDFMSTMKDFGGSGSCNNNVVCPEGDPWDNEIRSVVLLVTNNNTRFCSGAAINNTANDGTPYVLTADHCGAGTTDIFVFNYKSPTCSPTQDWNLNEAVQGCTIRASNAGTDFCLVELSSEIPAEYNAFLSGWSRQTTPPANATTIHHPDCDVMKISFNTDATDIQDYSGADCWHIPDWEDGTTEPGSSGSPLFNEDHQIIGQLFGGTANCNNNIDDYYGRFAISWDGNQANRRLRDWLDPSGSNANDIAGIEASVPQFNVDASLQSIDAPVESYCNQSEISPIIRIRNSGIDALTSFTLSYGFTGNLQTYEWTGNLATNQSTTITLPSLALTTGNTLFQANVLNPNNATDQFTTNNTSQITVSVTQGAAYSLTLVTDNYPEETGLNLYNVTAGVTVFDAPVESITGGTNNYNFCLADGCYRFVITDDYGDGICCGFVSGNGSFTLYDDQQAVIGAGGNFDDSDTVLFCVGSIGFETLWNQSSSLSVYPNPAQNDFRIQIHPQLLETAPVYQIVNTAGQLVSEGVIQQQDQVIPVGEFAPGVYLVRVQSRLGTANRRLVVQP